MSLSQVIRDGVETAFEAAGDLVRLGSLVQVSSSNYDPVTETYSGANKIENIRMIRTTVKETEMEASSAQTSDTKFLVPAKDLRGFDPYVADMIQYLGTDYNILSCSELPTKAMYIFFCRRK